MKMTRNGPADLPRHQVENRVEPVNRVRDAKLLLARPRGVGYHSQAAATTRVVEPRYLLQCRGRFVLTCPSRRPVSACHPLWSFGRRPRKGVSRAGSVRHRSGPDGSVARSHLPLGKSGGARSGERQRAEQPGRCVRAVRGVRPCERGVRKGTRARFRQLVYSSEL